MMPFEDEVRRALAESRRLSHESGFEMIRPAYMLLGILGDPGARATVELRREGVDVQALADAIRAIPFKGDLPCEGPDLPFGRAAKDAFDQATDHAQRTKRQVVTTLDLLVGIASVSRDPASELLRSVGIDSLHAERLSARHAMGDA
jgi:ATP-dependent Clp protease ATP-binding subunit ClpA